jgi:hypothetical protein
MEYNPHYSFENAANRMNLRWNVGSNAGNPDLEIPNVGECQEPEIVGII